MQKRSQAKESSLLPDIQFSQCCHQLGLHSPAILGHENPCPVWACAEVRRGQGLACSHRNDHAGIVSQISAGEDIYSKDVCLQVVVRSGAFIPPGVSRRGCMCQDETQPAVELGGIRA